MPHDAGFPRRHFPLSRNSIRNDTRTRGKSGTCPADVPGRVLINAIIRQLLADVRFTPKADKMADVSVCPICAVVSTGRRNTLSCKGKMECSAMRRGYFRGFTASEKTELWDRWQRGESLKAIGRAFGKPSSSIYFQLAPHGGIRPPPRRRSRLALTLAEREEISRAIALDQSARSIARLLGRSPSSVSREISRNGGYDRYRAAPADEQAWNRARRPKRCKLATNSRLRRSVAEKLRLNWSPEQIAGWLKRTHPEDESCQVRTRQSIAAYSFRRVGY